MLLQVDELPSSWPAILCVQFYSHIFPVLVLMCIHVIATMVTKLKYFAMMCYYEVFKRRVWRIIVEVESAIGTDVQNKKRFSTGRCGCKVMNRMLRP